MDELDTKQKLTRSKVLRRAGVGVAAVWAAPFVASSNAYAATANICTAPTNPTTGLGGQCGNACAPGVFQCNAAGDCGCGYTTQKCCTCIALNAFFSCSSQPCNSNRDCPAGFVCLLAPCCGNGSKGICVQKCPNPGAAAAPGAARTGVVAKLGG